MYCKVYMHIDLSNHFCTHTNSLNLSIDAHLINAHFSKIVLGFEQLQVYLLLF